MMEKQMQAVEQLRAASGIGYEEAKTVLEANNWEVLDAMIQLEREQKLSSAPAKETKRADGIRGFWARCKRLMRKAVQTRFLVSKGDVQILNINTLVLAILLLCFQIPALLILLLGLFFGYAYRFEGVLASDTVNQAMQRASGSAEQLKKHWTEEEETPAESET